MKKSLSIFSANLVYLITMLLVISVGSYIQMLNLAGGLIATEVVLIMLPPVLFLVARKIPLKVGLRLNPIRPGVGLICVLLGLAIFPLSMFIDVLMAQWSGMASVPLPENTLPVSALDSILYFIALAIFAPLGEEILFRGAVQGAYEERRSPLFAILITAVMFAFYHFRVSGLPALLPVSFVLGYVAWRTGSIYASMLIHFGMNATAAANTLVALQVNGVGLPLSSLWAALAGAGIAAGLLYALNRLQPVPLPVSDLPAETPPAPRSAWLRRYWPLLGAGLLYLGVAYLTLATAASQAIPAAQLKFHPPRIDTTIESRYQVVNRGGENVGELICKISPQGARFRLDCTCTTRAYEVKLPSSYFSDAGHTAIWSAVWDSQTLDLLEYSFEQILSEGRGHSIHLKEGQLIAKTAEGSQQIELPKNALLEYEWVWRVNDLDADVNTFLRVPFGYGLHWNESQKKSVPTVTADTLAVRPVETLNLPSGQFEAWSVTVAGQTAWYARNDPAYPRPVQFDDGMVIYSLIK
jgi:membrane protease YdiL (CAAX protease family)